MAVYPHTPQALAILDTLFQRQQGGAAPASNLVSPPGREVPAEAVNVPITADAETAGVPVAQNLDTPAAEPEPEGKPKKKRAPYKKSKNGRRVKPKIKIKRTKK